RGSDKDEDEILGRDLLGSEKNSLEHDIVTEDIVNRIDPLCEMVAISERTLIKLSNLQHLYRKISGKVKKGVSDMELIDAMAPTPAVSGKPLKKSIDILKKEEPFQRGWYSGVVGFAGKNISDYYVAIRSVLLRKDKMFIYSGAGIVPGSDPEKEWEEIDLKIKKYKKILKYEI
ncbi:MAG: chorismate-binding protein, partial [Candidatus Aminicenantes bacterium]|nr:chorismate-binding protein [Candidatus Aminicenantes bacterium]